MSHRITSHCLIVVLSAFICCASVGGAAASTIPVDKQVLCLDTLCDRLAAYSYGGAIGVLGPDGILLANGYGYADRTTQAPVTTTTLFDLGSLTKQFTAVAVMQLVGSGRLRTSDSLFTLLPDVPDDKHGITVSQLLTHTSGLIRNAQPLGIDESSSRDAFIGAVLGSELLSPPGVDFRYSDVGYDLLAAIVEIVTGEPFETYLRTHEFQPAGMHHTAHTNLLQVTDGPVALSYRGSFGEALASTTEGLSATSWVNRGSGGVCSSLDDMLLWAQTLQSGTIIPPGIFDSLFTPHVAAGQSSYGYAWFVDTTAHGTARIHHGGDIAGYKATMSIYPDDHLTVIAFCNRLGWEPLLDHHIEEILFGERIPMPPTTASLPMDALQVFENTFESADSSKFVLWVEDGQLVAGLLSQQAADLFTDPTGELAAALHEHNRSIETMIDGFQHDDFAMLSTLLRERDLAQGLDRRIEGFWKTMAERRGPVTEYNVIATVPAQDATQVTFLRLARGENEDVVRFVWRGDKIATLGTGLLYPSIVLIPTGPSSFTEFDVRNMRAGTLVFPTGNPASAAFAFSESGAPPVHFTISGTPSALPKRDVERLLLPVVLRAGVDSALAEFRQLLDHQSPRYDLSEEALNRLGYTLMHRGRNDGAAAIFRENVRLYPESSNAYDSYGEALLAAGDTTAAVANYKKALNLNPDNESSQSVLKALGVVTPGSE